MKVAERLRATIRNPSILFEGAQIVVTASLGIDMLNAPSRTRAG